MKICYNCFHEAEDSSLFCENCGFSVDFQNENTWPDALPCGTTLYGRYQIGKVLQQDASSFTYIAQDSRTKGLVAVREFFPQSYSKRTSSRTLCVPEENRDEFREEKDLFRQEAEDLLQEADSDQPPCVQSFFGQNDTVYIVINYGTSEDLMHFLDGKGFRLSVSQEVTQSAPDMDTLDGFPADSLSDFRDGLSANPDIDFRDGLPADPDMDLRDILPVDPDMDSRDILPVGQDMDSHSSLPADLLSDFRDGPPAAPNSSVLPEPGIRKKSSVLPIAAILGLMAVVIITFFLVLPRALSGFREIGQSIHSLQEKFMEEKKSNKKNPLKKFFGGGDNGGNYADAVAEKSITSGNYLNKGYYALIKNTCYFADSKGIYCASPKALDNSRLLADDPASYINVYDDRLFYLLDFMGQIICFDPDDGSRYVVYDSDFDSDYDPQSVFIYDDWCYFSNENNLFRFNLMENNTEVTLYPSDVELVLEDFNSNNMVYPSLCFLNGQLFYNGTNGITSVIPGILSPKAISRQDGSLFSDGKYLYCWFGVHKIYRIGMDGKSELILDTDTSDMITSVNCSGDWLYYTVSNQNIVLCRVSKDGSTTEFMDTIGDTDSFVISLCSFPDSDNIFIYLLESNNGQINPLHKVIRTY